MRARVGRAALFIVLPATALLLAAPLRAQDRDVALVHRLFMDREAVVERGEAGISQAALGERLQSGSLVATSPGTRAAIRFTDDGSLVRMNPNARLQVTSEGGDGAVAKTLQLEFGELWARVTEQGEGSFQVETPSGVAAVVGTELVVRVEEDGTTTVLTLEGAVEFFNGAGRVEVPEGSRSVAASDDAAPTVSETTDEEIEALGALVDEDGDDGAPLRLEVPLQNSDGVARTLILELPRDEARVILDSGGGR